MINSPIRGSKQDRSPGESLFTEERLCNAAWAFTTRRVPRNETYQIYNKKMTPRAGDLVLARVDVLGHHRGLQLRCGRRKSLFSGDEIVVAYGNRYASSQFEAIVPRTLGPCQLVAGGGVAGKALSWHNRISRGPTEITPVGVLFRPDGKRVNLQEYALEEVTCFTNRWPPTIAVVGTAMDAGKTDAAAFLVRGMVEAGQRVGYAKVTGTGAGGDTWLLKDAGADPVLDFTDAGYTSTYRLEAKDVERVCHTLVAHLAKSGVDAIILEVADGLLQDETAALLQSEVFRAVTSAVLFTARDSMGAVAGVNRLREYDLPVVGLSGVLTAGPLQCEEATTATGLPTYSREELAEAAVARGILAWIDEQEVDAGSAGAIAG
ncbi:MAG: DUF1611 domain-containing protein [bacterium]|nr:DUF1611 domain-containing protein [bacterium]